VCRESGQRYLEGTNVLETRFEAEGGRLAITDFMPLRGSILGPGNPDAPPELHRLVRCLEGAVEVEVEWSPRFDYARAPTRISRVDDGFLASVGSEWMVLGGLPSGVEIYEDEYGPVLRARFRLRAGEQVALVARYGSDEAACSIEECLGSLRETADAWRAWVHACAGEECAFAGPCHPQVVRSGLVLKLLTHPHTGAIAAAPTTSLPEEIGGVRNWDYRYTWIRDAAFTAQALFSLGHRAEALDFLQWAQRVSMVKGDRPFGLQIMYGLHGETELPEIELEHLMG
jgi:GH15 family glucan-1,4-alpha-glucosidase